MVRVRIVFGGRANVPYVGAVVGTEDVRRENVPHAAAAAQVADADAHDV